MEPVRTDLAAVWLRKLLPILVVVLAHHDIFPMFLLLVANDDHFSHPSNPETFYTLLTVYEWSFSLPSTGVVIALPEG